MNIEVRRLSFSYGERQALRDVSFSAGPGEVVSVLGPNGAGKSTMFRCMMGFLRIEANTVLIDGDDICALGRRELARRLAYIPQAAAPVFNHSVLETVLMGLSSKVGFGRAPGAEHVAAALETLESLGIARLRDRGCLEISGGERQLALLARALAQDARVLIMDEPTANLDYGHQHGALERARRLASDGYTVIMSTHNPEHAFLYSTKVLALCGGRAVAEGRPEEALTEDLLEKLYGIDVSLHELRRGEETVRICLPSGGGNADFRSGGAENCVI